MLALVLVVVAVPAPVPVPVPVPEVTEGFVFLSSTGGWVKLKQCCGIWELVVPTPRDACVSPTDPFWVNISAGM